MLNKTNINFWKVRQRFLVRFGYDGVIDGIPGVITKKAINKFQVWSKSKKFYTGVIDSDWGNLTERAYNLSLEYFSQKEKNTVINNTGSNETSNLVGGMAFDYSEMRNMAKQIIISRNKYDKLPAIVQGKERSKGKLVNLTKAQYSGLFESENIYYIKNNRFPSYVTFNSVANNPVILNYQDNKYNCCPASLSMISMQLFNTISESTFAKNCNTNTNGTSPSDMIIGAKKLGFEVKQIDRNSTAVKKSLDKGLGVLSHLQTKPKTNVPTCLQFTYDYGHYGIINRILANGNYWYGDPTKGFKECSPSLIDKATGGRDIHYYSVRAI